MCGRRELLVWLLPSGEAINGRTPIKVVKRKRGLHGAMKNVLVPAWFEVVSTGLQPKTFTTLNYTKVRRGKARAKTRLMPVWREVTTVGLHSKKKQRLLTVVRCPVAKRGSPPCSVTLFRRLTESCVGERAALGPRKRHHLEVRDALRHLK